MDTLKSGQSSGSARVESAMEPGGGQVKLAWDQFEEN